MHCRSYAETCDANRSPRSGPTSSAPGRIPVWQDSSTISPTIPARRRRCTSGSMCERAVSTPADHLFPSPAHRLLSIFGMVRYRFFLYAGLLPYGLGAAWAYASTGTFDAPIFWSGLGGVVLAV